MAQVEHVEQAGARADGRRRRITDAQRCRAAALVVTFGAGVVFVVMAVLQRSPPWYPTLDQAMIELLVRDVASEHSPTTGLVGRFVVDGAQGSHPGPLSWYLLWPTYRLFGATAWALVVANALLGCLAVAALMWIMARRQRLTELLVVAAVTVVLARAYGVIILSEVWNPHLPVLWWLVVVFAAWSVLVGDRPMVLLLVLAGSLCAQTHISYAVPVAFILVLTGAALVVDAVRRPTRRRSDLAWLGVGAGSVIVLWTPVILDQLTHDPGNLWLLWTYFTGDAGETIGFGEAIEVVLVHLDPWRLAVGELWGDRQSMVPALPAGSIAPGVVLLVAWIMAASVSWRLGGSELRRLHLVAGALLLVSLVAVGQIVPPVWYWVVLFLWGVQAVLLIAIGWTVAAIARTATPSRWLRTRLGWSPLMAGRIGRAGALVGVAVVLVVWCTEAIIGPRLSDHPQSKMLAAIVPPTVEALRAETAPGGGTEGRYLVRWIDPVALGSSGFGFVNELERAGFTVTADEYHSAEVRPHRVATEGDTTATIEFVGGVYIDRVSARPGAVQIAAIDLRSGAQRQRFDQLHRELARLLAGNDDRLRLLDENPMGMRFDQDLDGTVVRLLGELIDIGVPMAVFVTPR